MVFCKHDYNVDVIYNLSDFKKMECDSIKTIILNVLSNGIYGLLCLFVWGLFGWFWHKKKDVINKKIKLWSFLKVISSFKGKSTKNEDIEIWDWTEIEDSFKW